MGWALDTTLYEFDPLEPGDPRTVGGYPLRARIGAGGMGRVYLSFTPGGRPVAVKLIRGELASDPEFRERFAREVSIAQQVNGIHIAQLIDSGSDRGVPWLASAYVAGPSLAQVVAACGPLPPATVLSLAGRIAESLGAIHATGMVHRDLKPGNILLDESGPKVIDFGIVRAATPTVTGRSSHRTFIGSPPFMAPEQIRGRKVTPATDVFALGATVYYLSTGESAFQADFADGVLYRVMHDEPDYEACPEQVRELIRACLRKEPEERPSTQRIVDGCRAAGAGPETPLPDEVRAMIQARAQALTMLAANPAVRQAPAVEAAPEPGETEQETATDPGTAVPARAQVPDLHAAPTATAPSAVPTVPEAVPGQDNAVPNWAPPPTDLAAPTVPNAATVNSGAQPWNRRGRTFVVALASSLVTAAAAAVIALVLWPSNSKNSAADSVTQSSSRASTSSRPTATVSSATVSGSDPVQWQGQVLITVSGTDLDSVPVDNGASIQISSLYDESGLSTSYALGGLPNGGNLAVWTGSTAPTRSQCYNEVSSQGVSTVTVSDGTVVCVITAQERVALVKVVDDQADNADGILTDATVWSQVSTATATAN